MREATIDGVSALDDMRPRKAAAPKAKRKGGAGEGRRSRFRRFRSRFGLIVGSAGFSAMMIGIVLNATVMQRGHHPAPLFTPVPASTRAPDKAAPVVPAPALQPQPVSVPAAVRPAETVRPADPPAAPPAPTPALRHAAAPAAPARGGDAIARLLGAAPAGAKATSHAAAHDAAKAPVSSHPKTAARPVPAKPHTEASTAVH